VIIIIILRVFTVIYSLVNELVISIYVILYFPILSFSFPYLYRPLNRSIDYLLSSIRASCILNFILLLDLFSNRSSFARISGAIAKKYGDKGFKVSVAIH